MYNNDIPWANETTDYWGNGHNFLLGILLFTTSLYFEYSTQSDCQIYLILIEFFLVDQMVRFI